MKKFITTYIVLFFQLNFLFTQDIHFSQQFIHPLALNPSLTGNYPGEWRATAFYRNQWQSVTLPYRTYSLSGERNFLLSSDSSISFGAVIMQDITGDSRFNTLVFNLSSARQIYKNKDSTLEIRVGIQPGITQRSIREDRLRFDKQYNGWQYDPSLPTGENFNRFSFFNFNLNTGINIQYQLNENIKLSGGIGAFNLLPQKETFYNEKNIRDRRWIVHTSSDWRVNPVWSVLPFLSWQTQGKYKELIYGLSGKYKYNMDLNLYAGLYARNKDAFYFRLAADYQRWHVSVSYDLNYSLLVPASRGRGGIELGIIYIYSKFRPKFVKHKHCPVFL